MKNKGIIESIKECDTKAKATKLLKKAEGYEFISPRTLRKAKRLVDAK